MSTPDTTRPEPGREQASRATAITAGADATAPARAATVSPIPAQRGVRRRWWLWILGGVILLGALGASVPWIITAWSTVSTDDAYVNGHVTFVAPRVPGQVARVLVDDNNRVRIGDLLVLIAKGP